MSNHVKSLDNLIVLQLSSEETIQIRTYLHVSFVVKNYRVLGLLVNINQDNFQLSIFDSLTCEIYMFSIDKGTAKLLHLLSL
jgi:hypothetical protein